MLDLPRGRFTQLTTRLTWMRGHTGHRPNVCAVCGGDAFRDGAVGLTCGRWALSDVTEHV